MQDRTSELPPNVSRIVADALQSAADGLARWLDLPVRAESIAGGTVDCQAAANSLVWPHEFLCCCVMPVAFAVTVGTTAGAADSQPDSQPDSAGRLLMTWTEQGAAKLIDLSLHGHGTPSDPSQWRSLDRSVMAETLNVVGCEFLNAVAVGVSEVADAEIALMPSPPIISRQRAGSLLDATWPDGQTWTPVWSLSSSHFQFDDATIETRFAMAWAPTVWRRLHQLVQTDMDAGGRR
jgi:hypothetical protein